MIKKHFISVIFLFSFCSSLILDYKTPDSSQGLKKNVAAPFYKNHQITNINVIEHDFASNETSFLANQIDRCLQTLKSIPLNFEKENRIIFFKSKISIDLCSINITLFPEFEFITFVVFTSFRNILTFLYGFWLSKWVLELLIFGLLAVLLFYLSYRNARIKLYSKTKYLEQKKFIHAERQRISAEMHDEIGAGLSAIKLFSEMAARNRQDVGELKQINTMINDIADKINEIIWSTNTESDNLESLFDFIENQSRKLFEHSDITFTANLPQTIPDGTVSSQVRRNNYLLIKEILHNALKHSRATSVHLGISINNRLILYHIKDNGTGFDPGISKINSMGLSNVKLRIENLKGSFTIENYKGTSVLIKIPLDQVIANKKQKRKRFLLF